MAQSDWVNPHANEGNPGGKTTVYADVSVMNGTTEVTDLTQYLLGAFVDGEFRWVNQIEFQTFNGKRYMIIDIPGDYGSDTDNWDSGHDKPITFKLRKMSDLEENIWDLSASTSMTFVAEGSYGQPSNPVLLSVTMATSVTIDPFDVDVNSTVNLLEKVHLTPADASLPSNHSWEVVSTSNFAVASVTGDVLKGLRPYRGAYLRLRDGANSLMASTKFNVLKHANSISIVTSAFTVNKNDNSTLTSFMGNQLSDKAYKLDPTNANDIVEWEYDATYIEPVYNQGSDPMTLVLAGYNPKKGGTTTIRPYFTKNGQKVYPENPSEITLTIHVPVTAMNINWPEQTIFYCNVGDDNLYQRLKNIVTFEPGDASDTSFEVTGSTEDFEFDDELVKVKENASTGGARLTITHNVPGEVISKTFDIFIQRPMKEVAAIEDELNIDSKTSIANAATAIRDNVTLTPWNPDMPPQDFVFTSTGVIVGSGSWSTAKDTLVFIITSPTDKLVAGTATVNASLTWNQYNDDNSITKVPSSCTFTVNVYDELANFIVTVTPKQGYPRQGTITLTPNPSTANFDLSKFSMTLASDEFGSPENPWNTNDLTQDTEDPLKFTYACGVPGLFTFVVSRTADNQSMGSAEFTVPASVNMYSGWQWMSNPWGYVAGNDVAVFFGPALVEARTYDDLLINDSEWGIMGSMTTTGIAQGQMYKVKMSNGRGPDLWNGHAAQDIHITLKYGWNWVGSPYIYDRRLTNIFRENVVGMIITSKTASAENDGTQWKGDLKILKSNEGFMVYNPLTSDIDYVLPTEGYGGMYQGNERASARSMHQSVWHYDHSQFANNMTMVAELPELANAGNYTIGAFVGDECRGEGCFEDGLAFITVHCNSGEQVSFRLHNELTDEYFDIDQTVVSRQRIGSLKSPFRMTSTTNEATAISTVLQNDKAAECYDLSGRRVDSQCSILNSQFRKGVSIQRQKDGTVRKVIMK